MHVKKLLSIFLSLSVFSLCVLPVNATDNIYYKESGQIDLQDYNVNIENNNVKSIHPKSKSSTYDNTKLYELCDDKNFKQDLIHSINNNENVSVGYTTIYLKEVKDSNGSIHYEPLTVAEMKNTKTTSPDKVKYSLSFNLTVTSKDTSSQRTINTSTYIYWKPVVGLNGEKRVANGSDDFMTISYPKPYVININRQNGGLSGPSISSPYLNNIDSYNAVSGFRENNGGGYMKASSTQSKPSKKRRRFVAKYVHTWDKIKPSFSLGVDSSGTGSVNIGLSSSASAWQIATYVDYSC